MSSTPNPLLVSPTAQSDVLSVRAKAMIFADPLSQQLLAQIEQFAPSEVTVLITGDTGTGKELVARHLHAESGRKGAFVAVNCGALSHTLAEAELFGHQAGSFTGASETRAGWFEVANHGTLFLDELGDLPLPLQVKLLRVIQEREVVRVGARTPIRLNVRVIAATNIDLPAAIEAGRFRPDLYYRLNVVTLKVPPLAERPGDILPLTEHFLRIYADRLGIRQAVMAPDARASLLSYQWPGNIRELENVVHAGLLTARDGVIRPENLRYATSPRPSYPISGPTLGDIEPYEALTQVVAGLLQDQSTNLHERIESLLVHQAFESSGRNQVQAARLLGVSRNTVRTLLKRYKLLPDTPA